MTDVMELLSLAMLALAGVLAVAKVIRSGSLPDKVLGADSVNVIVIATVAAGAGTTNDPTYLDVLVAVTLLGFIGNLTVARYVERRGARV